MTSKIPDFSIVPTKIFSDKRMTFRALKVYAAIKAFMNKDTHDCFPSRQLIAEMTDIPVTRISVETDRLEQMGWIKKVGTGGRSMPCVYTVFSTPLHYEETVTESDTVIKTVTVTELITVTNSETVTESDETVTELSENGYRIGVKTVTESVTGKEQTKEQTRNRQEEQTSDFVAASPPMVPGVPSEPQPEAVVEKPKKPKQERKKKPETFIPENFSISEAVKKWATEKGYSQGRLDANLESFVIYANSHGKTYVDWDSALMGAIRNNWAKFNDQLQPFNQSQPFSKGNSNGYQPKLNVTDYNTRMFAQAAINQSKDAASHSVETGRVFSDIEYSVEGRGDVVDLGLHDQPVRSQVG